MGASLEQSMTWSELCDHTINKLKGHFKTEKDIRQFKDWFMLREKVGYRFDAVLIFRAYNIWKDLHNNLDHFAVICGREGFGKTTLSVQLASWVDPDFSCDSIVYGSSAYVKVLQSKMEKYNRGEEIKPESLVLDEGTELLSRESLNESNRVLTKTFFVQRALKYLVFINIPNFHMLDTIVRKHRVRTLIEVTDRGRYKAIVGVGIQIVTKDGERQKAVSNVRLPIGCWWEGYFNKDFPSNIDFEEYTKHKMKGIDNLLIELGKKDGEVVQGVYYVKDLMKLLSANRMTILSYMDRGLFPSIWVGQRRAVTAEVYQLIEKNGVNIPKE